MMRAAGNAARRAANPVSDGRSRAPWCGARGRSALERADARSSGGNVALARLSGHRPHCHQGCSEDDPGDHHRRLQQPLAATAVQASDADTAHDERDQHEECSDVCDGEADPDPGGLVDTLRQVAVGLLRVDPLGAEAHHDVARQRDGQQRPVSEPQRADVAASEREDARTREQAPYEDHRPEDVDEEREVPVRGPMGGEQARHAPGFQIMSMRIRSTTRLPNACSTSPRCVRLIASSSAFGPVCPAAWSSSAFFMPAMYSLPVRPPIPVATAQRTIAAMIHPSQMSYPPTENASQIPNTIVPPPPIPAAALPIFETGAIRIVPSGVSVRRTATIMTQNSTSAATRAKALSTWSARTQSSRLMRCPILCP